MGLQQCHSGKASFRMIKIKVSLLLLLCAPLFASATSSGERCGTKKFGPNPDIVCDEGLSCQQWQGLKGPGAHYCFGPCIEEGEETSKGGNRFGVCCEGLQRVKRKCVQLKNLNSSLQQSRAQL